MANFILTDSMETEFQSSILNTFLLVYLKHRYLTRELSYQLNVSETTKYLIFFGLGTRSKAFRGHSLMSPSLLPVYSLAFGFLQRFHGVNAFTNCSWN